MLDRYSCRMVHVSSSRHACQTMLLASSFWRGNTYSAPPTDILLQKSGATLESMFALPRMSLVCAIPYVFFHQAALSVYKAFLYKALPRLSQCVYYVFLHRFKHQSKERTALQQPLWRQDADAITTLEWKTSHGSSIAVLLVAVPNRMRSTATNNLSFAVNPHVYIYIYLRSIYRMRLHRK